MRIRLSFFMDVPENFAVKGYTSTIAFVRTALAAAGLRTSIWHIAFEPQNTRNNRPINCNGPTGTAS